MTDLATHSQERALKTLDVERIRKDFPILELRHNGAPLRYLDNAATSQKPRQVIDAVDRFYREQNANVHRGVHHLSDMATRLYEGSREKVRGFFNIPLSCEVIFTRGATEAINLVAQTFGRNRVGAGDEVVITGMEHHSNIVPWQMLCEEKDATLRVIPIRDDGSLCMEKFEESLNERTRLLAVSHVSNALGTVNPLKEIVQASHDRGIPVLVDGAQSAPHMPVDLRDLDCDFFVCSSHKMCGPTGVGMLYGRAELLDAMPPWQGGGDMILSVSFDKTTFNTLPHKFEAGTPNIAGAIGFGEAVSYLRTVGMEHIAKYEQELLRYGTDILEAIPGVRIIGAAPDKAGVLSFVMECAHPHDIGQILDEDGVAVRAGHHCAQPVMQHFGVPATARASLAFYNTEEDLEALGRGLRRVKEIFG